MRNAAITTTIRLNWDIGTVYNTKTTLDIKSPPPTNSIALLTSQRLQNSAGCSSCTSLAMNPETPMLIFQVHNQAPLNLIQAEKKY